MSTPLQTCYATYEELLSDGLTRRTPCPSCNQAVSWHKRDADLQPQSAPDYDPILDSLEAYVVAFLNSEKGPSLACKVLARFKKSKKMGSLDDADRKFVANFLNNLEFRITVGVSDEDSYMEAIPETNEIGVNKDWLNAYAITTDEDAKVRHKLLMRLKALNEIGHLLTLPFLRYLAPNTTVKVGQWNDKVEFYLEEELLGGRLEHSYTKKAGWHPTKLVLEKIAANKEKQCFDIKDTVVSQLVHLDPSNSILGQFRIKPTKYLYSIVFEKGGGKRKASSYLTPYYDLSHGSAHPTKRFVFTGLGISPIPGVKA